MTSTPATALQAHADRAGTRASRPAGIGRALPFPVRFVLPDEVGEMTGREAVAVVVDASNAPDRASDACRRVRQHPDGKTVPLVVLLSPEQATARADVLRAGADAVVDGADTAVAALTIDALVTRHRRERGAAHEAARLRRDLDALVYAVSHDLRAPLRAIDGFSSALAETLASSLDGRSADYMQRVRAAAGKLAAMIDGLLELSRVSRAAFAPSPTNLSAQIRAAAATVARAYPLTPVLSLPDAVEAVVDPGLTQKLFERVLDNCCKFAAPGAAAMVDVEVQQTAAGPEYILRDHGVGFDPAYAGKLFRPFQRLHSPAEFTGIGIGLAIVHRIVERHGGSVAVDGQPGGGATLRFTLTPPGAATGDGTR